MHGHTKSTRDGVALPFKSDVYVNNVPLLVPVEEKIKYVLRLGYNYCPAFFTDVEISLVFSA